MPELPEVETIRQMLRKGDKETSGLIETEFSKVEVLWEKTVASPTIEKFYQDLPGQRIEEIGRRGKFLIFNLSTSTMLIHLRMSGDLVIEGADAPFQKHARVLFFFRDERRLSFIDPRKFGRVWLVDDPQTILGKLGPESLDSKFSVDELYQKLLTKRRQLKQLMLDQTFIAGLGNIYTDEILNLARLHPARISSSLSWEETNRMVEAMQTILSEGILRNGSSIDWVYRGGEFQNQFRAYQRRDQPCKNCGTLIQRMVIGQRSTYYCPFCQVI